MYYIHITADLTVHKYAEIQPALCFTCWCLCTMSKYILLCKLEIKLYDTDGL